MVHIEQCASENEISDMLMTGRKCSDDIMSHDGSHIDGDI